MISGRETIYLLSTGYTKSNKVQKVCVKAQFSSLFMRLRLERGNCLSYEYFIGGNNVVIMLIKSDCYQQSKLRQN